MKRYTFAVGTFTCLIVSFDSCCKNTRWEKSINCTHCFITVVHFLHGRDQFKRQELLVCLVTYSKLRTDRSIIEFKDEALNDSRIAH